MITTTFDQGKCPSCGSTNICRSYDGKVRSLVCNNCGHNWKPRFSGKHFEEAASEYCRDQGWREPK